MALFTGDSDNNTLNGAAENDILRGLAGNDTLNGGLGNDLLEGGDDNDFLNESGDPTGNDTLDGGSGDDVYAIYSPNTTVREDVGGGNDTIWTAVDYSLAVPSFTLTDSINIESIYVTGNATVSGNGLDNFIAGNGADNHVINGLDGNDRLFGGSGRDTLTGGNNNDYLNGGAGINLLVGGEGNDTLDGNGYISTGNTFQGGQGDDVYGIYDTNTVIVENADGGNDSAWVHANYTLQDANGSVETIYALEDVTVSGNASDNTIISIGAGVQTLNGLGGNDKLFATSFNDTLNGGDGDDTLDGGGGNGELNGGEGNDVLYSFGASNSIGGNGNDNYVIYNFETSIVEEASGGTDTVWSAISLNLANYNNVENLYLIGSASGNGNAEDNLILGLGDGYGDGQFIDGLGGNDTISGGGGDDSITGGQGADILTGGTGNDVFTFSQSDSSYLNADRIQDFRIGQDFISLNRDVFTTTRSANNSVENTLFGLVQSAFTDANGAIAGNQALGINDAVIIESTNASIAGTYLIVNNDNNAALGLNDLVINITGYRGILDGPGAISQQLFTSLPQS